ncbi:hypothetical protein [Promicromonospora sp. NPDC050880]|uniref:hypothetical protein n=1 Tax=unclassified Promicromonospora TaxID=2647929 RepID=UPI00379C1771
MTEISPAELAKLVRAVAVLALPADGQIAWLSSLGMGEPGFADELAMELEDGALLAGQFVRAGWIEPEVGSAVAALDSFLAVKSRADTKDFWSLNSLRHDREWDRIRSMAADVLRAL